MRTLADIVSNAASKSWSDPSSDPLRDIVKAVERMNTPAPPVRVARKPKIPGLRFPPTPEDWSWADTDDCYPPDRLDHEQPDYCTEAPFHRPFHAYEDDEVFCTYCGARNPDWTPKFDITTGVKGGTLHLDLKDLDPQTQTITWQNTNGPTSINSIQIHDNSNTVNEIRLNGTKPIRNGEAFSITYEAALNY